MGYRHYYSVHDTILVVESCKYLGSKHIQNITTKASHTLSFFKRNLKLRNQHIKQTAPSAARIQTRKNQSKSCKICNQQFLLYMYKQYKKYDPPATWIAAT